MNVKQKLRQQLLCAQSCHPSHERISICPDIDHPPPAISLLCSNFNLYLQESPSSKRSERWRGMEKGWFDMKIAA